MDEAELKTIEARAHGATKGTPSWAQDLDLDVVRLVAEVRRLRGLIKWAEGTPYRSGCLWCGHDVNGEYENNHRGDCMAFTEGGEVK